MSDSKTIVLSSNEQAALAIKLIDGLPKDKLKPKWSVVIEKYAKQRSIEQNKLYWKWMTVLMENRPENVVMTREKWHYAMAIMFLEPIEVPDMKTGELRHVPRSTTGLNTGQFTEYLNHIEEWALSKGILLPTPEDYVR